LSGDPAGAEDYLRQAVERGPDRASLWGDLSEIAMMRGHPDDALAALERYARLGGEPSPDRRCRLGGLLATAGRANDAIEQFELCVAVMPDSLEARYDLGGLLRRAGRFDEAIEQLEQARRLAPGDADTHVELGLAYAAVGRNEEAVTVLRRAIELAPGRPESIYHLPGLIEQLDSGS
jgi:Flp pilus assembly protein TadD